MNRALAAVFVLLLVIMLGLLGWGSRTFLMQNKVTFLLNQREFEQADAVLQRLVEHAPDDLRTMFLQTKTLTLSGKFKGAVEQSGSEALAAAYPEVLYWRALAEYHIGYNGIAAVTAEQFLQSKTNLPNGAGAIAKALADDSHILEVPDKDVLAFRQLFPVEQSVYTGLAASQQMEIGRLETAARLFRSAFILDNRNRKMLYQACKVNALVGYIEDAQMFFDYSKTESIVPLFEDFEEMLKGYRIASLTLHNDDLPQGGRKIDVARAFAWSANVYLQQDPEKHAPRISAVMGELTNEYPYDVVLQVRKAGMLKIMKNYEAALSIYQNLQQKFPNYTVLVKMAGVEGISEAELSARSDEFMDNLVSVTSLPLSQIRSRDSIRYTDYMEFKPAGSATATISVNERGSYIIMLVARGTHSGELWPLVEMYLDDNFAGVAYIFRKNWDCYTMTVPLEAGTHELKLVYDNDIDNKLSSNDEKGFSLRAVYVALTGVTDVR